MLANDMSNDGGAREFQPPARPEEGAGRVSVFLAGSIEQGKATEWQREVVKEVEELPVDVFNPRRKHWEPGQEQRATNPYFYEQVTWEQDLMEQADIVAMYFDPKTKAPISLLELGYWCAARPEKLLVCCSKGFWRFGNVEMMQLRHEFERVDTFDEFLRRLRERVAKAGDERGCGQRGTGGAAEDVRDCSPSLFRNCP